MLTHYSILALTFFVSIFFLFDLCNCFYPCCYCAQFHPKINLHSYFGAHYPILVLDVFFFHSCYYFLIIFISILATIGITLIRKSVFIVALVIAILSWHSLSYFSIFATIFSLSSFPSLLLLG